MRAARRIRWIIALTALLVCAGEGFYSSRASEPVVTTSDKQSVAPRASEPASPAAAASSTAAGAAPSSPGETIYREQCARCHGDAGEGTKEYPHTLVGDKSAVELAAIIARTMPKDSPGDCTGADADLVARYLHDAFYSPIAQARMKPPRIELSRLTVRQYQTSLADLIGSFRGTPRWKDDRGLTASFGRRRRGNREGNREEDRRRVSVVDFNFKGDSPEPGKIDPKEYTLRWQGAILAPDAGEYEFILKTENGARLWVNDDAHPLIDNGVKSGKETEFRASIKLLAGRAYPLRVELNKSKDQKTASISLWWKRPRHTEELVAERYLLPEGVPPTFVVNTPFPPDDRSTGYERGTSISKAWDQATTDGAIEMADYVVPNLQSLAGVDGSKPDHKRQASDFCRRFAERAFRRPLDELHQNAIEKQFVGRDVPSAVRRCVLLVMKSPLFLYRETGQKNDAWDTAARLSFTLWDSLPDEELRNAAQRGDLSKRDQVVRQAQRMAADVRAQTKLREFLLRWLRIDQAGELAKDSKAFAEFTPAVASDLRTSLELSLDDLVSQDVAGYRDLIAGNKWYLNGPLGKLYGASLPDDAPFVQTVMSTDRAGLLTHPYLMATFAYTATSSPIHRGVFLSRSVLGRMLRQPPEAVAPVPPDVQPDLSTRERITLQTSHESCAVCHTMINSLGFTLENFDAIGRYRFEERGKPVNSIGEYQTRSGELRKLSGAKDLAEFLASSEESHAAFVEQLFHHLVKQPIRAYGPDAGARLQASFAASGDRFRPLAVEIALLAALELPDQPAAPTIPPAARSADPAPQVRAP